MNRTSVIRTISLLRDLANAIEISCRKYRCQGWKKWTLLRILRRRWKGRIYIPGGGRRWAIPQFEDQLVLSPLEIFKERLLKRSEFGHEAIPDGTVFSQRGRTNTPFSQSHGKLAQIKWLLSIAVDTLVFKMQRKACKGRDEVPYLKDGSVLVTM